mgnify:CR=1 FL=1
MWVQAAVKMMLFKSGNQNTLIRKLVQVEPSTESPEELIKEILTNAEPVHHLVGELLKLHSVEV